MTGIPINPSIYKKSTELVKNKLKDYTEVLLTKNSSALISSKRMRDDSSRTKLKPGCISALEGDYPDFSTRHELDIAKMHNTCKELLKGRGRVSKKTSCKNTSQIRRAKEKGKEYEKTVMNH